MRTGRPVVVSDPMPPQSVIDHLEIGADLWRFGQDFNFSGEAAVGLGRGAALSGWPIQRCAGPTS
jgi:dihydrofolate synthase/folylpolyglutamate synthase